MTTEPAKEKEKEKESSVKPAAKAASIQERLAKLEGPIVADTNGEHFVLRGRPCELSADSFVAPTRTLPPARTFYFTPPSSVILCFPLFS